MLHTSLLTGLSLILVTTSVALLAPRSTGCIVLLRQPKWVASLGPVRRVTTTSEEVINLNPSLSGDGRIVGFETTGNLTGVGSGQGFRAIRADLSLEPPAFAQIGLSRAVTPAISQDGSRIAFASTEDLVGTNPDRNSEIFLFDGAAVSQITNTTPADISTRVRDGNFQPSITDDGSIIAFSSNRNLTGLNTDHNFEVLTVDTTTRVITQITSSDEIVGATEAKISGDGSHVAFIRDGSQAQSNSRDLLLYDRGSRRNVTVSTDRVGLSMTYGRAINDDGSRVVYSADTAPLQSQVFLFDARFNTTTQITALGARADDVPLHPTISGDGKRIAFATRRNVIGGNNDRSVELYGYDTPTRQVTKLTEAPAAATGEVVSSLNDDGSIAVFSFPRVLSGSVSSNNLADNSEIYVTAVEPRPAFGTLMVFNAAAHGNEPGPDQTIASDSIASAKGTALSSKTEQAGRSINGSFPLSLAGTTLSINGRAATILYVSPGLVTFVVPHGTELGPADVVLTNSEGFRSRTNVTIIASAPGLFTLSGDGRGEGVVVNADTLLSGPFDPTGGQLRLLVFATGARDASDLSATIAGRTVMVESIQRSRDLPGLDEAHIVVPSDLRGAGTVSLTIVADNHESNVVEVTLNGSFERDILINELLADPPDGLAGDANHDGVRNSANDEFVELVNTTTRDIDLSGYHLQTRGASGSADVLRHRFAAGTVLTAGTAIVVFGGGDPDAVNGPFGGARIYKASSGGLSLVNSGGLVTLRDASSMIVSFLTYGGSTGLRGDANESLTRSPDVIGNFRLHQMVPEADGRLFSPGTRLNGTAFLSLPAISKVLVSPASISLTAGEEFRFTAKAFDHNTQELSGVIFAWQSNDTAVATVDHIGLVKAVAAGNAQIMASARGVQSTPAVLIVTPSPTPSPTPAPSPSPSSSPPPSPSPTPSPVSSPSPTPIPLIVISELRTRGPNGASDEFVELYNNSDLPIAIAGWKIRGSSNSGAISTRVTISAGTVIPARGHFLAAHSGYSGSVLGDKTYTSGVANDGGIALTLPDDSVVDQVGLSVGSAFKEGMHLAPLPSDANQSYERRPGGLNGSTQDTNDNFTDFQLMPSDPQNLNANPTPGPSPTPGPTPSPSPSPTPSPVPTPTPSPSPPPSPSPSPSPTPLTKLVISQIYGGGGNSGAPFRNDFIEIFNGSSVTVSLAGWSVQYAGATGTSWSVTHLTPVSVAPGQFYLIQESSGGSNGANLPPADATGVIAMAATAGKVALVNVTTPLSGACPADETIMDLVGYGSTANCFRGIGPTAAPSNARSVSRKSNGCTDTANNASDFATGEPTPRNMMTAVSPCPGAMASRSGFASARRLWCELFALVIDLPPGPFVSSAQRSKYHQMRFRK